ncbi:hypothetical protein [Nocardia sp. NPDC020380]|uniref:hypothetical protein n=1 Tax=Nocardia sp. NPDC020380 TaxID=3364309 RepID=UPI0037BD4D51
MPETFRPPGQWTPGPVAVPDAAPPGADRPGKGRVFNYNIQNAAQAAAKFGRIRSAQEMTAPVTTETRYRPSNFFATTESAEVKGSPLMTAPGALVLQDIAGPRPISPRMPDPDLPEKIDQKTKPKPAPAPEPAPAPAASPASPPVSQAPAAPAAGQTPSGTDNPILAQLGLVPPSAEIPVTLPPAGGIEDVLAIVASGKPVPGKNIALPSGTSVTTGADDTTIIGTTDPITGHNTTNVYDRNGLLISTAESEIVLGTGGLSRDTTITDIGGAVSQVRSVDDGHGHITTWTANPDGSHSVRYPDGTVIKEPAPGSTTPAELVQLDPDGLGGHVTDYNLDGTTSQADFRPGILNAPVTDITGPDGEQVQVVTVPGQTNGAPYSIITGPDKSRVVYQPDGTTVPIDRYNDIIGGPNYGNQFDPLTGTWRSDPVTARGPIITGPDGISSQEWTYRNKKNEERTATATFDANGYLTSLQSGDYTGVDVTTFETFDGITLPKWSNHADAGNVKDESRLYWDAILTVSGLPELGWTAGRMIGTRIIASQLAARGVSDLGIELATSQLAARGATTLTGVTGTTRRIARGELPTAENATTATQRAGGLLETDATVAVENRALNQTAEKPLQNGLSKGATDIEGGLSGAAHDGRIPTAASKLETRPNPVPNATEIEFKSHGGESAARWTADLSHVTGKTATSRNRALEAILSEDFGNLAFSFRPQYSPFVGHGVSKIGSGIQIGPSAFVSREQLRNTLVHEELHHRWWQRGILDGHHPRDGSNPERTEKFYGIVERYMRMRGWL